MMDLHRLPVDQAMQAGPVDAGWSRVVSHGPMTIAEVLERGRTEMDEQDRQEAMAADPIAYLRAHRPRRLIDRLLGR